MSPDSQTPTALKVEGGPPRRIQPKTGSTHQVKSRLLLIYLDDARVGNLPDKAAIPRPVAGAADNNPEPCSNTTNPSKAIGVSLAAVATRPAEGSPGLFCIDKPLSWLSHAVRIGTLLVTACNVVRTQRSVTNPPASHATEEGTCLLLEQFPTQLYYDAGKPRFFQSIAHC